MGALSTNRLRINYNGDLRPFRQSNWEHGYNGVTATIDTHRRTRLVNVEGLRGDGDGGELGEEEVGVMQIKVNFD